MAVTPVYGWPIPDLGNVADGPDGFAKMANSIEATVSSKGFLSYTPAWTSGGSLQPSNPISRLGRYRVLNGWCDVIIQIGFGPSTSGGKGQLRLSLPVPAVADLTEQLLFAALWCPGAGLKFLGVGQILTPSFTFVTPLLPIDTTHNNVTPWMSAQDGTGVPGTGFPEIPGSASVQSSGNIYVQGRYLIA
jgi:hypothetical protein